MVNQFKITSLILSYCLVASIFALTSTVSANESTQNKDANNWSSIAHFRAFAPPILQDNNNLSFVSKIIEDNDGYLWVSGSGNLVYRYDGFELKPYTTHAIPSSSENQVLSLHKDSEGQVWLANSEIHYYDETLDTFVSAQKTNNQFIYDIVDDGLGNLWLGGNGFGFVRFDKRSKEFTSPFAADKYENAPDSVQALAMDKEQQILWIAAAEGLYKLDIASDSLNKIKTPLDREFPRFFQRDISFDPKLGFLWLATPKGLLRVNTKEAIMITCNPQRPFTVFNNAFQ